jgi:hypothetical protein
MTISFSTKDFTPFQDRAVKAFIPEDDRAKLIYYLKSVRNVLPYKDVIPIWMIDYFNYESISPLKFHNIVITCQIFSPEIMFSSFCFKLVDSSQLDGLSNRFYQEQGTLKKVMVAEHIWFDRNYFDPLKRISQNLHQSFN